MNTPPSLMSWPLSGDLRTVYPPAVPGGIVLRVTRTAPDGEERERVESPPVPKPGEAMRSMRRAALAYAVFMTTRSRINAALWDRDTEELYAALSCLSSRRSYSRSWALRNGDVLTLSVVPAGAADARPAAVGPEQHGVPSR